MRLWKMALVPMLSIVMTGALTTVPQANGENVPGTRPADARVSMSMTPADTTDGLMVAVNERGKVSQSSAGPSRRRAT